MSTPDQSQVRTRMFARAFGPFFTIVPSIVAARATTQMPVLLHEFAGDPMWQWVLGAILLMWGSAIIAFHQYWRSVAAVLVSLLGWFLVIRGVLILAIPDIYDSAGKTLEQNDIPVVRAISHWGGAGRSVPDLCRLDRKAPTAGTARCRGSLSIPISVAQNFWIAPRRYSCSTVTTTSVSMT